MGHFVTGVTVVTALEGERPVRDHGQRASSVSASIRRSSWSRSIGAGSLTPIVRAAGRYAVSILSEDQQALSDCFAGPSVEPGPRRVLRRGVASGPDRPAAHRRRASPRSNAPSSRRSRRATTTCSSAASMPATIATIRCRCSTPATLPAHRARRHAGRASRSASIAAMPRSARTDSRSGMRSPVPGRR